MTTSTEAVEVPTQARADNTPGLTLIFQLVAMLEMLGGFVVWAAHLSERATAESSTAWMWLIASVISALLFWALGDIIRYLRDIRDRLEAR